MTTNQSTLWGELIVDGLYDGGVSSVVIAPGSRSTPLVVAAVEHPDIQTYSILDERSAAFFALGRGKVEGTPTAVVCTSGTAGANMHPAVMEADQSRSPLVVCTADRPADLQEAGANQTANQSNLFGDAVRWSPAIPPASSKQRSIHAARVTAARAAHRAQKPTPGPVHLNIPFRKPLSPTETDTDVTPPPSKGQSVSIRSASPVPTARSLQALGDRVRAADRPLIVAGPMALPKVDALRTHLTGVNVPILADPLSGIRFGVPQDAVVIGGYDAFLDTEITDEWPAPDLTIRFGARPTSVALREFLRTTEGQHIYVNPYGDYADPSFSTTDIVSGEPAPVFEHLCTDTTAFDPDRTWVSQFLDAEQAYWNHVSGSPGTLPVEGEIAHEVVAELPDGATLFVSNSMPIRDVDRFGKPTATPRNVLGNRGVSGIDGIVSSAIGAASVSQGPVVLLTGDLAFYHDMNGLLALERCDVDLTIVVVNNDGGGIFHMLPIAGADPPFTDHFRTPHGMDFSRVAKLYDIPFERVSPEAFSETYAPSSEGSSITEVEVDAEANHTQRRAFQHAIRDLIDS